jgi:hypothetical protein
MIKFLGGIIMKSNKLYFIAALLVLFLAFSFSTACEKVSDVTGESVAEITDVITDILEDETAAEEEQDGETIEAEVEVPVFQEELDEIQQQYSVEFRQYLETLDEDYLESLLDDDNAVKQEYDLFDWRNTFYENNIIFIADGNIFPSSWYGSGIDAKAESLSAGEVERSKSIMITALDKYPTLLLKNNLKNVYVLKSMSFYGVNYGGTNSPPDIVYVVNDGVSMGWTDIYIEETFHHEFSSVLKYNYGFDETAWRQVNPAGFVYFDEATGGAGAIKAGKASKTFDSKEHKIGFLYEYAESTLENDLNSFAENIFMGEESFFDIVESYDKLEMKLDLIVAFYNSLDPMFTIEYFKGL